MEALEFSCFIRVLYKTIIVELAKERKLIF